MKNLTTLTIALALGLITLMIVDLYALKKEQTKHETMAVSVEKNAQQID